ncbi:MAG: UDP-N-acetylmuramoyl-L-alanyl-D-glutamate--2,6-diaminopimelate ligase [Acidiferrobacterales bacterium]
MSPMRLSQLLDGLVNLRLARDPEIRGISSDSRTVESDWLFLAAPGVRGDGREHIGGAVARGAIAVVFEPNQALSTGAQFDPSGISVPAVPVPNLRASVGLIADRFFNMPSRHLSVIGVTGTNGKTTCTHLLAQVLDQAEHRCGLIGTLGAGFPGALDPASHTTPDPISVHRLLARFVDAGATSVCMEVSSHALDQGRVEGVAFDIAVFTNLTRDHLDYHGTMEAYAESKSRLFGFRSLKAAVINIDDSVGRNLIDGISSRVRVTTFGLDQADVTATEITPLSDGLNMHVMTPVGAATLRSPLLGRFNAMNLLAALAVLLVAGAPLAYAIERLSLAQPVVGRMERFGGNGRAPLVVVDYAHTPDALEKALSALREHTRGRLWCVFGCGGDRDRGKRPQMGKLAEGMADVVILTDDNPRHEPPDGIIADISSGMTSVPIIVRDRAQAISLAIRDATEGDSVLVAGKGHEDYQQIEDRRLPFSDREIVMRILGEAA